MQNREALPSYQIQIIFRIIYRFAMTEVTASFCENMLTLLLQGRKNEVNESLHYISLALFEITKVPWYQWFGIMVSPIPKNDNKLIN